MILDLTTVIPKERRQEDNKILFYLPNFLLPILQITLIQCKPLSTIEYFEIL